MPEQIHDVIVKQLKLVTNPRGHLMEVQSRNSQEHPGFGQVYMTFTKPHVVKAWYRHQKQVDQLAITSGAALLALYDDRSNSPTHGFVQEILLDASQPQLVLIPPKVWHGFQALKDDGALILHLNSEYFDPTNLDEERLDTDDNNIPYRWA